MPFRLHPSGFCCHYSDTDGNLTPGVACPYCGRVAGHALTCPKYVAPLFARSARANVFNAAAVLWAKSPVINFLTFTLPTIAAGKYQVDPTHPDTGDIAIGKKFSKVLEAFKVRQKRAGHSLSYLWVAEAQTKRGAKYGGPGDIHYHLICNVKIKDTRQRVVDVELLQWLQALWCKHVGTTSNNCLHVDYIPPDVRGIPGYLTKYMNKGASRVILSRRFFATHDLSRFKPVSLYEMPEDIDLCGVKEYTAPDGYTVTGYYFNTRQVLEIYGDAMADQLPTGEKVDARFSPEAIVSRAYKRQQKELHDARTPAIIAPGIDRWNAYAAEYARDRQAGSSKSTKLRQTPAGRRPPG